MKVYIGSDHGGYKYKELIKKYLAAQGIDCRDVGPFTYNPADDYPDYAFAVAQKVVRDNARGILICRNGIGVSIVANKVKGIRAVSTAEVAIARTARADDNTNILCLGQDFVSPSQAKKIVAAWLATRFSGQSRHQRRLRKISKIEQGKKP